MKQTAFRSVVFAGQSCKLKFLLFLLIFWLGESQVNFAVTPTLTPNTAKSSSSTYSLLLNATTTVNKNITISITFPSTFALSSVSNCSLMYNGNVNATAATCSLNSSTNIISFVNSYLAAMSSIQLYFVTSMSNVILGTARYSGIHVATLNYYDPSTLALLGSNSVGITIVDASMTCSISSTTNIIGAAATYSITYTPSVAIELNSVIQIQLPMWSPPYYLSNFQNTNTTLVCGGQCTIISPNSALSYTSELIKYNSLYSSLAGNASMPSTITLQKIRNPSTAQPITAIITVLAYLSSTNQQQYMSCTTSFSVSTPNTFQGITFSQTNTLISGTNSIMMLLNLTNPITSNSYLKLSTASNDIAMSFVYSNTNQLTTPIVFGGSSTTSLLLGNLTNATTSFSTLFIGTFIITNPPYANFPNSITFLSQSLSGSTYYPSDTISVTITSAVSIISQASISMSNTAINTQSTYTLSVTTINPLINNSKILIILPAQVSLSSNGSTCVTSIASTCSILNGTAFQASLTSAISGGTAITISLGSLTNAPTTTPTSSFIVSTFYYNLSTPVDTIYSNLSVTSTPVPLGSAVISSSSNIVGASSAYTITINVRNTLPASTTISSYLTIQFPSSSFPSATPSLSSFSIGSTVVSTCNFTNTAFLLNFSSSCIKFSALSSTPITIALSSMVNPLSTKPTNSLSINTYTNGLLMEYINAGVFISMTRTTSISSFSMTPTNSTVYATAPYTVATTFQYSHYSGDRIIITLPASVTISNGINCSSSSSAYAVSCALTSSTNLETVITLLNSTSSILSINFQINGITNNWYANAVSFAMMTTTNDTAYYYVENGTAAASFQPGFLSSIPNNDNNIVLTGNSIIKLSLSNGFALPSSANYSLISMKVVVPNELIISNSTLGCSPSPSSIACILSATQTISLSNLSSSQSLSLSFTANAAYFSTSSTFSISFSYSTFAISTNATTVILPYCINPCKSCAGGSPNTCLSCLQSPYGSLPYYLPLNSTCVNACPSGYYLPSGNTTCYSCNTTLCLTCVSTSSNCTSCSPTTYLMSGQCLSVCPNTYFGSQSTCIPCVAPCYNCTSNTTCLTCLSGYYLNPDQSCTPVCKSSNYIGIFAIISGISSNSSLGGICYQCSSTCLTCAGSVSNCSSCTNTYILYNGTCTRTCADGMFNNSNSVCQSCISPCFYCNSATACITCVSGYYLFNVTQCVSVCPAGMFQYVSQCASCNSICSTCSLTAANCTSCISGSYFYLGSCLSECPALTYPYNGTCTTCVSPCATCLSSAYLCSTCITGYLLLNVSCVLACPSIGYLTTNTTCIQCQASCLQCTSSVSCSLCAENYYLLSGSCTTACPTNYPIIVNRTCTACDTQCATCSVNTDNCESCSVNYFQFKYTCLSTCPIGYYSNVQTYSCQSGLLSKIVFFPVFITFLVIIAIVITIKCISPITSAITLLTALSLPMQIAIWAYLLSLLAAPVKQPGISYVLPIILCIVPFISLIFSSIMFYILNKKRIEEDDYCKKWLSNNLNHTTYQIFKYSALCIGFKVFRVVYCKAFNSLHLSLVCYKHENVFRMATLCTIFCFFLCEVPIMVAAFYLCYQKIIKDQIFYTSIEALIVTALAIIFSFIDIHKAEDYFQDTEFMKTKRYIEKVKDASHINHLEDGYEFTKQEGTVDGQKYKGMSGGKFLIQKQDMASMNELYFENGSDATDIHALDSGQHKSIEKSSPRNKDYSLSSPKNIFANHSTPKINIFEPIQEEQAEYYEQQKFADEQVKTLIQMIRMQRKGKVIEEDENRQKQIMQERGEQLGLSPQQIQELEDSDNQSMLEYRGIKQKWNHLLEHRQKLARKIFNTYPPNPNLEPITEPLNQDDESNEQRRREEQEGIQVGGTSTAFRRKMKRRKNKKGNKELETIYLQRLTQGRKKGIFTSQKSIKYDF